MDATLEQIGTPLAEIYRGSGRLSGRLVAESAPANELDRDTNYRWVGSMTQEEFEEQFEREQHNAFHYPSRPEWNCQCCIDAGWTTDPWEVK